MDEPDDRTRTRSGPPEPDDRRPLDTRLGMLGSFSELAVPFLQEIESSMVERRFAAGEPLMRQGDPGDSLMVVQEGEVEVRVVDERETHVL